MDQITGQLIDKLEERTVALQLEIGTAEMTTRVDMDARARLGKRPGALSAMDLEFEAANSGTSNQGAIISARSAGETMGLLVTRLNAISLEKERVYLS